MISTARYIYVTCYNTLIMLYAINWTFDNLFCNLTPVLISMINARNYTKTVKAMSLE